MSQRKCENVEVLPISNTNSQLETGNIGIGNISTLATFYKKDPVDSTALIQAGAGAKRPHDIGKGSRGGDDLREEPDGAMHASPVLRSLPPAELSERKE